MRHRRNNRRNQELKRRNHFYEVTLFRGASRQTM